LALNFDSVGDEQTWQPSAQIGGDGPVAAIHAEARDYRFEEPKESVNLNVY